MGAAAGTTLALALLVCGCVFAAMAGPALSLHARSQALHQITAKLDPTVKTVQIGANWTNFVDSLLVFSGSNQNVPVADQNLTASQLARTNQEIKASLAGLPLPLGPGAWYGLTAQPGRGHLGGGPQRGGGREAAQARGALPQLADQRRLSWWRGATRPGPSRPGRWRWRSPRRPRPGSGCTRGAG